MPAVATLTALAAACAAEDPQPRASGDLVLTRSADVWEDISLSDTDPFAQRAQAPRSCSLAGWFIEEDGTEVDTGLCNFVSLQQPSLVDVRDGDELRVVFFHFDLTSAEPAQGYAALALDDEVVWEYETRIPGPAGYFDETLTLSLDRRYPAGTPVTFHLDNHGQNTWKLSLVQVNP